jgi:hypothetical protein
MGQGPWVDAGVSSMSMPEVVGPGRSYVIGLLCYQHSRPSQQPFSNQAGTRRPSRAPFSHRVASATAHPPQGSVTPTRAPCCACRSNQRRQATRYRSVTTCSRRSMVGSARRRAGVPRPRHAGATARRGPHARPRQPRPRPAVRHRSDVRPGSNRPAPPQRPQTPRGRHRAAPQADRHQGGGLARPAA